MTTRRQALVVLGAGVFAAPLWSFAQPRPAGKVARIGFLGATSEQGIAARMEAFRAGLRDLGYVEGKNILIEYRWADGDYDRLPALAAELVRLKVDVLVTHAAPGAFAAKRATTTIPIVFAPLGDALSSGIVTNLARPGGNITGSSFFTPEISAKRLELLREVLPRIRRVAILFNAANPGNEAPVRSMEAAGASLKMDLKQFGLRAPGDLEGAFAAMSKARMEAVAIVDDPMIIAHFETAARLAVKHRLPTIGSTELPDAGGMMAYGVNLPAMARIGAVLVDKILKGANPGDLPIEQATTFDLIINRKTAKVLGVTIPPPVIMRAVKVIE